MSDSKGEQKNKFAFSVQTVSFVTDGTNGNGSRIVITNTGETKQPQWSKLVKLLKQAQESTFAKTIWDDIINHPEIRDAFHAEYSNGLMVKCGDRLFTQPNMNKYANATLYRIKNGNRHTKPMHLECPEMLKVSDNQIVFVLYGGWTSIQVTVLTNVLAATLRSL